MLLYVYKTGFRLVIEGKKNPDKDYESGFG